MKIKSSSSLPYGYGIGRVEKSERTVMNIYKDREKQNEEKKETLLRQKTFLEYLQEQEKISSPNEDTPKVIRKIRI